MSIRYPVVCLFFLLAAALWPQSSFSQRQSGEHLLAVVPLTGSGTYQDPRRPLFAPAPNAARNANGILAYSWEPSDDGRFAIVEFVATNPAALRSIAADSRVVKAFDRGKHRKDEVEKELKKYRKVGAGTSINDTPKN